jgi:hypothetical protein
MLDSQVKLRVSMKSKFGVVVLCCFSIYGQVSALSAKTLFGSGQGSTESAARLQSLQAIAQQVNPGDFDQSQTLSLLTKSALPDSFASLVTLSVLEPFFAVNFTVSEQSGSFKVQAKYDVSAHVAKLTTQMSQYENSINSLKDTIESLSLSGLNDLLNSDRALQKANSLLQVLYSTNGRQPANTSSKSLSAYQLNSAIERIDSLSKLQASSRTQDQQEAAKEIYAALAEQISITVKTRSIIQSELNDQGASQAFQQLTETSTNLNLSGVQITANSDPQINATYVGVLYPRRAAAQQEQLLQGAQSKMLLALRQTSVASSNSAPIDHAVIDNAIIDNTLTYLIGFNEYTQVRQKYNTLMALSGGSGLPVPPIVSPYYADALQSQLDKLSAQALSLNQVGKIIGFFNGAEQAISLCPVIPSAQHTVANINQLERGLNSLASTQQSAAQLLRFSVKQENSILLEIVGPQGEMVYTNSFVLHKGEFSKQSTNPAATVIVLRDTSDMPSMSTDELYDLMQQQIDVGDALMVRAGCLPALNDKQGFLSVANMAKQVIELDINYNFDSFILAPSPIEHKFCRVRINGKHHNLSSNKTTSLFVEGKQSPIVDQESAIAQASTKAFRKLEKRLNRLSK